MINKLTSSRITWDKENKKWVIHNWKLREIEGDKETYTTGQKLDTVMAFQPSEFSENPKKIREQLTFPELDRYIDRMKMRGSSNVIEFQIEKYKMIANAFATFILTFIGVSISSRKIRGRNGTTSWNRLADQFFLYLIYAIFNSFCNKWKYESVISSVVA